MPTISDDEFGDITIRRNALSKGVKLSVAPDGRLRISMPRRAPLFLAKRLLNASRADIRRLKASEKTTAYHDQMPIGKSHMLHVQAGTQLSAQRRGQQIIVSLPSGQSLNDAPVRDQLRHEIIAALRREAKSYLPKRLAFLAAKHGFSYQSVRFSHAGTRWGSCSSKGTISLNIALMTLPFELIDYVLIHELAHTRQMNHSERFWSLVSSIDPEYKAHRAALKAETPSIG